jgi:hypothetical protein
MDTAPSAHWRIGRAYLPDSALLFDLQRSRPYSWESSPQLKVIVSTLRRGQSAGLSGYPTSEGDYRLSICGLILSPRIFLFAGSLQLSSFLVSDLTRALLLSTPCSVRGPYLFSRNLSVRIGVEGLANSVGMILPASSWSLISRLGNGFRAICK